MRNSQAFKIELIVKYKARTEIGVQQASVNIFENLESERAAIFLDFVDLFFEFSKHGLTKKGLADILDLAVDKIGAHLRLLGVFEEIMGQELLIEGRCDLGKENGISVILEALMLLGEPAVHGVAGFVGQGENVGENVRLVVHQDIGRVTIAGGRKCPTPFSFRFVAVHPSRSQSMSKRLKILLAEWLQRFQDDVDRFIKGRVRPDDRNHWDKSVVLVNFVQLQDFFSKLVVVV